MKRLQRGQKYFDSGDYNMAKAKMKNKQLPSAGPDKNLVTGDHIPTPQDLPQRKSSLITSKLAGPGQVNHLRPGVRDQPGQHGETLTLLKTQKLARRGSAGLQSQQLRRLRDKNHLNPGSRGRNEPRLHHCIPAWRWGQAELMPVIPVLWEAKAGGLLEARSSIPAWPTWQNPDSTNNTKISHDVVEHICHTRPVILAFWEAKAGRSPEVRSSRPNLANMVKPRLF
ncbi:Alpha-endosulfine [Plecturocebus cupreus]